MSHMVSSESGARHPYHFRWASICAVCFLAGIGLGREVSTHPPTATVSQAPATPSPAAPTQQDGTQVDALRSRFRRPSLTSNFETPDQQGSRPGSASTSAPVRLNADVAKYFASQSAARRDVYTRLLTVLGMSQPDIEGALHALDQLHHGAIKAGDSMLELLQARRQFDRGMRDKLGEAAYDQYRAIESLKPYYREVDEIRRFAGTKAGFLNEDATVELAELLKRFDLHTTETWDGPYDPAPRPRVGMEPILAGLDQKESRIAAGLSPFLDEARQRFSVDGVGILSDYYDMVRRGLDEDRRNVSMTPDERKRQMEELAAPMREAAKPSSPK